MTENQIKAKELYPGIKDKENYSEDFLYNAICYFELEPEKVVDMLNAMPTQNGLKLCEAFQQCREETRRILQEVLAEHDFSEAFHRPEIEDILFYQVAHGLPIS